MDWMIRRDCLWQLAATIFVVLLPSGCSTISKCGSKDPGPLPTSVELTAWLEGTTRIRLPSDDTSLAEFLDSEQAMLARAGPQMMAAALREQGRVEYFLFDDNCVVLQRADAYWYFLEPAEHLELYAGRVPLKEGDKIFTLPFQQSIFVTTEAETGPQYAVRDLMQPVQARQIPASESLPVAAALFNERPLPGWTTSIVTRVEPGAVHHLVLPGPVDSDSVLPREIAQRLTYTSMLAGISGLNSTLRSGDLIERLNVVQLKERF